VSPTPEARYTDARFEAVAKTLRWIILTSLFVFAVVIGWTYYATYQGRVDINNQARQSCVRGVLDRADAIGSEHDSALFRHEAAIARRRSGDLAVADEYDKLAAQARARAKRRAARLLGARLTVLQSYDGDGLPSRAAVGEAERVCDAVNPAPGAWPWDT
jgi:hypothetical protein